MPSTFSDLLHDLSNRKIFPIKVEDIIVWLDEKGFSDDIVFYPVEMPEEFATGFFTRWLPTLPRPYCTEDDQKTKIEIGYSLYSNPCWRRYICTKELLHIFDVVEERASTSANVDTLIHEIVRHNNPSFPPLDSLSKMTLADISTNIKALFVLAPCGAIDSLKQDYIDNKLTNNQIARFFKIPEKFVDFIFTEEYLTLYSSFKCDSDLRV